MKKILSVILALALMVSLCACDSMDYKKALSAYEAGNYQEARAMFEELGDYENSADMVTACDYQLACQLLEDGKYEEAISAFTALGDFEDSKARLQEATYQQLLALKESGDADKAWELLQQLGEYKDSGQLRKSMAWTRLMNYLETKGSQMKILDDGNSGVSVSRSHDPESNIENNLMLVYSYMMSGVINIQVTIGFAVEEDGQVMAIAMEEASSYAADWTAAGRHTMTVDYLIRNKDFTWSTVSASGYNANGKVTGADSDTLWFRLFTATATKETLAHLKNVVAESNLGITMEDIGFAGA